MKITANTLLLRHFVQLQPNGIEHYEGAAFSSRRFFPFEKVDAVLRGPQLLSFQVGTETFSIPIDPTNSEHRTFVARLVLEVKRTLRKG